MPPLTYSAVMRLATQQRRVTVEFGDDNHTGMSGTVEREGSIYRVVEHPSAASMQIGFLCSLYRDGERVNTLSHGTLVELDENGDPLREYEF